MDVWSFTILLSATLFRRVHSAIIYLCKIVSNDCSIESIFLPISVVVGLTLNGVNYTNNSIVTITEIGTGSAALLCTTTLPGCCFSGNGGGWFFPNGDEVMRAESLPYYRTRARNPGALLLNHNPEGTTTGIFRCDIAVTGGTQSLYVGVYTSTTGECY